MKLNTFAPFFLFTCTIYNQQLFFFQFFTKSHFYKSINLFSAPKSPKRDFSSVQFIRTLYRKTNGVKRPFAPISESVRCEAERIKRRESILFSDAFLIKLE